MSHNLTLGFFTLMQMFYFAFFALNAKLGRKCNIDII